MDVEAAITDSDVRTSCSSHCEIITNVERCGLQICDLAMSGRITTILPGNGHHTALDTKRGLLVRGDHDVTNDGVMLGLGAGLNCVALVGACAICQTLLCSLGILHVIAIQIAFTTTIIRDLEQTAHCSICRSLFVELRIDTEEILASSSGCHSCHLAVGERCRNR